jgi:hypothetical protein
MVKRILIILIIAAVLFVVLMFLLPTEKGRFKRNIRSFQKAVEQENTHEALRYISAEYRDRNGMDHSTFAMIVQNLAAEFDSMNVSISGLKVFIDSTDDQGIIFASCSLGLRLFARYQGERTLLCGGIVKPASVRAWFKKTTDQYQVYDATY